MTGDWVMGIIGGVLIMLMGGGFFYVFSKIDALGTRLDAKFDKQNEVIAGIAKDIAVILDRLHIDDRLARRYPSTKSQSEIPQSQSETVESRLEAGV